MYPLENPIQEYAWGSRTAIAELLGLPVPSPKPQAELWLGAHPAAPSQVRRDGSLERLDAWIEREPERVLGPAVNRRFGARLPFLLKLLAAETPLSLQAHPSQAQAEAGFEAEERAGVPRTAPHRNYKDPHHKPELLCALTPFYALCGFRDVDDSLRLFAELDVPALNELVAPLRDARDEAALKALVQRLLTEPAESAQRIARATAEACAARAGSGEFGAELAWGARIGELYPGDLGIVTALLLNLVELQPGQAIYLPARKLHAYLGGVGVEIMASSDNVLRGGLTPKHVDTAELLRVLEFSTGAIAPLSPVSTDGELVYETPAPEFRLSRVDVRPGRDARLLPEGPEILLVVSGELEAQSASGRLALKRGQSAFVPASSGELRLSGSASVFRARVNL